MLLKQSLLNEGQVLAVSGYCGPHKVSDGNSASLVVGSFFFFCGEYAVPVSVNTFAEP